MTLIEVTSEEQFTKLTKENTQRLVVLYFYTTWAAPCQSMSQVVKTLAEANENVDFLKINADEQAEISDVFEISAVPFFIVIKNSTILREISGADPKEIVSALKENSGEQTSNGEGVQGGKGADNADEEEETAESLEERLSNLTKAARVMLFMKGSPSSPQCGFSRQLVAILREHQVRFGFFDILKDDSVRQGLKKFSDWPTFPQLYLKGEFQGGLDIVKESVEEDPEFFQNALKST